MGTVWGRCCSSCGLLGHSKHQSHLPVSTPRNLQGRGMTQWVRAFVVQVRRNAIRISNTSTLGTP